MFIMFGGLWNLYYGIDKAYPFQLYSSVEVRRVFGSLPRCGDMYTAATECRWHKFAKRRIAMDNPGTRLRGYRL